MPSDPPPFRTRDALRATAHRLVRHLVHDSRGATTAEYALLPASVALVAVAGARVLGSCSAYRFGQAAALIG